MWSATTFARPSCPEEGRGWSVEEALIGEYGPESGPTGYRRVVALTFAHPTGELMKALRDQGDVWDLRSGRYWDMFFAGYYSSGQHEFESKWGAIPVGGTFSGDWWFRADDLHRFESEVEIRASLDGAAWEWSGADETIFVPVVVRQESVDVDWLQAAVFSWERVASSGGRTIPDLMGEVLGKGRGGSGQQFIRSVDWLTFRECLAKPSGQFVKDLSAAFFGSLGAASFLSD